MRQSELILNEDGSIYHLGIPNDVVPDDVITVGDPDRVSSVSRYFDEISFKRQVREFHSVVGRYNGKDLLVISTGIGTDNIDIVFNELDACVNVDFRTRTIKSQLRRLNFYRIGTSGAIQEDIDVDSFLVSEAAVGMDGLLHFYSNESKSRSYTMWSDLILEAFPDLGVKPYATEAAHDLLEKFHHPGFHFGLTLTANGFYAPQGRNLRIPPAYNEWVARLSKLKMGEQRLTNLEMETAGIYGMAQLLNHRAISVSAILANRVSGEFSTNPGRVVDDLIQNTLDIITAE